MKELTPFPERKSSTAAGTLDIILNRLWKEDAQRYMLSPTFVISSLLTLAKKLDGKTETSKSCRGSSAMAIRPL